MPEYIEREKLLDDLQTARNQSVLGKTAVAKFIKFVKALPKVEKGRST